MRPLYTVATAAALALSTTSAFALTVTNTDNASTLAAATLGASSGISIVGASESLVGTPTQQGTFSGFNQTSPTGPTLALEDGIVLTSGLGNFSTTNNTTNQANVTGTGNPDFAPLVTLAGDNGLSTTHNDTNVLSFDFILDDPTDNAVTADFIFGTDEFPTQSVTDIMAIFVNGVNFAFFPNGDLVSNQGGDPNAFFNDNPVGSDATTGYGLEWNGLTDVFSVTALANGGGAVNTIDIAIADTSDSIFDSALFFSNLQSGTTTTGGGIDPNPVPLPAGLPLMLLGLGAFGWMRRKQKAA
ncbi:MAG: choice-of-anchor L domain-containing protein [Pseudomonadota bacterium]